MLETENKDNSSSDDKISDNSIIQMTVVKVKTTVVQMTVIPLTVVLMTVVLMTAVQMTVVQMTVVQMTVVQMTVVQTTVVQMTVEQITVAQRLHSRKASKTRIVHCGPVILFKQLPEDLLCSSACCQAQVQSLKVQIHNKGTTTFPVPHSTCVDQKPSGSSQTRPHLLCATPRVC